MTGPSPKAAKTKALLKFHPIANTFPLMSDAELKDLAGDIKHVGLQYQITLHTDGSILDGRNRYIACELAGVKPEFETYDGDDPVGMVVSCNLRRRHLSESQRGMIAGRLSTMKAEGGRPAKTGSIDPVSRGDAADKLNVSEATVKRARAVQRDGIPELAKAVDDGDISLAAASEIAKQPKDQQRQMIADGPEEATKRASALRNAKDEAGKKFNPKKEVAENPDVRWSSWVARAQSLIPYCPRDCANKLSNSSRQHNAKRIRQFIETLEGCLDALESTDAAGGEQ